MSNVAVACTATVVKYSVGGTVSGLAGTLVLQDNGGDDLSVSGNGAFAFATTLADGAAYQVSVKTNPAGQSCTVTGGSGTVTGANVSNVAVACTATVVKYSVGGTVSGLAGTLVLQDNGGDDLSVSGNGAFAFATTLADGAAYQVSVKTNPAGQSCTVTGGSGTVTGANVSNVTVACTSVVVTPARDAFNRADGGLGAGWAAVDGGLLIAGQRVTGSSGATAGEIRSAESYAADQWSQLELTSAQLSGSQWVGPAVRMQSGGQNMYLGIYFWNSGSPQLRLYKRSAGSWVQLGNSYNSGALAAGTQLKLAAVGSRISFLQNGVERVVVTDSSFTGGAPGLMAYDAAKADNWAGGGPGRFRRPDGTPDHISQHQRQRNSVVRRDVR